MRGKYFFSKRFPCGLMLVCVHLFVMSAFASDVTMRQVPLPEGLTVPEGFQAWMFEAPFTLGNIFFDPMGGAYVFSSEIGKQKLIRTDRLGRVTTYADAAILAGTNLKSGMPLDWNVSSILMTVDYWPGGGNSYGGIFKLHSDSTWEALSTAQNHGGTADIVPAPKTNLFLPAPLPSNLTMLEGMTARVLRSNYTMGPIGSIFFNSSGDLFVFTHTKNRKRLAKIDASGNGSIFAENSILVGRNWKHGAPYGSSVLVAIDSAPTESPHSGIYQIDPDGTVTAWRTNYGGLYDIIPAAGGGFYFSEFEADNVYHIASKTSTEAKLITSNIPPALTSLAYDSQTGMLYALNRPEGGGWPFGGQNIVYKITGGQAIPFAAAPSGSYFTEIAVGLGGIFGFDLYATDSTGGKIYKVTSDGTVSEFITGLTAPSVIRFDPTTGDMVVGYDMQYLIRLGSNIPEFEVQYGSAGWYFSDFENDNIWYLEGEGKTEVGLLDTVPPGLSMLTYNETDDFLYAVNWTGGWPFGGDNAVYRIEGNGKATAIATGSAGSHSFDSIAMSQSGPFGKHIYASDSVGNRIVFLENTGGTVNVVSFVTGIPAPSYLKFSPATGELIVVCNNGKNVLWVGTDKPAELENLIVDVTGPKIINPGQEVTFLVRFMNGMEVAAQDAVVVLDLPKRFKFLSSTGNGILRSDTCRHQIFWKLGDLSPNQRGERVVKMMVPWGLPRSEGYLMASIGAINTSSNFEIEEYLNYVENGIVSDRFLTPTEINDHLSGTPSTKDLYDYAISRGYASYQVAREVIRSDGFKMVMIALMDPDDHLPALLISKNGAAYLEKHSGDTHQIFDQQGGIRFNLNEGTFYSWGEWAVRHSPNLGGCMYNCALSRATGWFFSEVSGAYKMYKKAKVCWDCAKSKGTNLPACEKCANNLTANLPYINKVCDIADCAMECGTNPSKWFCTRHLRECEQSGVFINTLSEVLYGSKPSWYCTTRCDTDSGRYDPLKSCQVCPGAGECNPAWTTYASNEHCTGHSLEKMIEQCYRRSHPGSPLPQFSSTLSSFEAREMSSSNGEGSCSMNLFEVRVAHDPNAKSIDVPGNVLPGQRLIYTIEYENTGEGTAYGVFIVDFLDSDLDETSLEINDNGSYYSPDRLLSWDIGTLTPGQKGSVSFSVEVKSDLPSGTEVLNDAEVHFPSADEITPTNPVLSIVKTIAADPKALETTSGTPVSITLTGRDSGANPLTYRIITNPIYGELSGTLPDVTYTSMEEFIGQDEFYFVVNNGLVDSDPARVVVNVNLNLLDENPPTVLSTYPEANAAEVPINPMPVSTDPVSYLPTLSATFSEPIDASTITPETFMAQGLTGKVFYDEALRTAYFTPSNPLSHSTTYTATLTTGIKDKAGNALAEDYVWQFTTNSAVQIRIVLNPPEVTQYDFWGVSVGASSGTKIAVVTSSGTSDLFIGSLALVGTGKDDFVFAQDNCSGVTLKPGHDCTVGIYFKPLSGGVKNAMLSIPSNAPDAPKTVPLSGTGLLPNISVSPTSYEFGNVNPGDSSAPVSFTISNSGTGALFVSSIGMTDGDTSMFDVTTGTCPNLTPTLEAGKSCTILITFSPSSAGLAEATLSIISNDPDTPIWEISLTGRGGKLTFVHDEGTIGTVLNITGTGFGAKKGKVLIGGAAAKVLEWDNAHIKCLLSKTPLTGPGLYDVVVQIKDPKGTAAITEVEAFTVKAPEITAPNPHGAPETEVTLKGNFFGTKKGKMAIEVGGQLKSCKVTEWWMDATTGESRVRFMVPKGLATETYPLKLTNKVGTATIEFKVD